jgi:hypothetical protein
MSLPEVIKSLLEPASYPERPSGVELKQTHISYLLFTPEFVYKVKKPVDFGFLDFTTLEKRRFFCQQELILNRRMTEGVYIDVVAIVKGGSGKIRVGGGRGETVEYAVKMKRLPAGMMMNRMLEDGRISSDIARETARVIAKFHLKATSTQEISRYGLPAVLRENTEENFVQTEGFINRTVTRKQFEEISRYTRAMLEEGQGLFLQRVEEGDIKDVHGDIHSDHVCVTDGIQIFDCIEFNERFRYSDVVADMAFLAMDMDFYNRHDLSKVFAEAYFEATKDMAGIKLLDFYKCYRAYVRGKVEGFKLDEEEVPDVEKDASKVRAMKYFHLADLYATGGFRPTLIVVCGFTGTGKTMVAGMLSERLGIGRISSDVVRKGLAGISQSERMFEGFEEGIYSRHFTDKTYAEIIKRGMSKLKEGCSIILDATFSEADHRNAVVKAAENIGVKVHVIECTAGEDIIKWRLKERFKEKNVISDGRWEIYKRQKEVYERINYPHITLDTSIPQQEYIINLLSKILD